MNRLAKNRQPCMHIQYLVSRGGGSTGALGARALPKFYAYCQCPPKNSSSVLIMHACGITKVAIKMQERKKLFLELHVIFNHI